VHIVLGALDPLTAAGRSLVDSLPNAAVTVIGGAGHHPQLTHPEAVAAAIAG
jgi:pimeloyl-ACP methyl ester carboxylesterase